MSTKTSKKIVKDSKSSAEDKSKKGKHAELIDEFMQAMQPRTRGPSWKDIDPVSQSAPSTSTDPATKSKKSKKGKDQECTTGKEDDEQPGEPEASGEPLSDMDWLRRRTKTTLDSVDAPRKVFEQSDDENMDGSEEEDHEDSEVYTVRPVFLSVLLTVNLRTLRSHLRIQQKQLSYRRRVFSFAISLSLAPKTKFGTFFSHTVTCLRYVDRLFLRALGRTTDGLRR